MESIIRTLAKIDAIIPKITSHREYSQRLRQNMINDLNIEAHKHSNSIELEADPGFKKRSDRTRIEKETMVALNKTWEYLNKEGLSKTSLSSLGHILDPCVNLYPTFRHTLVQFGPFMPPADYISIITAVDNLVYRLGREDIHPIIRSIEAHIETVKIHPYIDGNGRIARLLQNYVLIQNNYPPANIPSSERDLYIKLIQGTLEDRFNNISRIDNVSLREDLFHEFICSKVLSSAEKLEDYLKKHRIFEVELSTAKKEIGFSIAKIIRNYHSQGREGIKVNLNHSHGSITLSVEGDISRDCIDRALNNSPYNLDYSIRVKH